jgi:lipopolysaccharide transport system permease protein
MPAPARSAPAPRLPAWLQHLHLAWPLAKRDVMARYRGSALGIFWALLTPLAMVAIYALVFRGVFQARWGSAPVTDAFDYTARLFAGLMAFTAMAEVASRAPRLMQDNANLVKRVVFPLELLCVGLLMQVAVHSFLQMLVLAALLLVLGAGMHVTWLLLPLAWAWLLLLQFTVVLVLAALGPYLRDLQHVVPVSMTGLMFLTPVFYPVASAPEVLRALLLLNPLTAPIEFMRAAWFGEALAFSTMWPQALALALLLPLALWLFARLRPGFPDLV